MFSPIPLPSQFARPPSPEDAPQSWKNWASIMLKLERLPPDTEVAHLWQWFSKEGDIAWIEIFDSHSHRESSNQRLTAKMRFEPPPKRNFWANGR